MFINLCVYVYTLDICMHVWIMESVKVEKKREKQQTSLTKIDERESERAHL